MDKSELYSARYDAEWIHRSHLFNMTNFCMVTATIVGTALFAEMQSFNYESVYSVIFIPLALISFSFLVAAFVNIRRALVEHEYQFLPKPEELEEHFSAIEEWQRNNAVKGNPNAVFEEFLKTRTVEASSTNFDTNSAKASYVRLAMRSITRALAFLAVASIPYLLEMTNVVQAASRFLPDLLPIGEVP